MTPASKVKEVSVKEDIQVSTKEETGTSESSTNSTSNSTTEYTILNLQNNVQTLISKEGEGIYVPALGSVKVSGPLSKDVKRLEKLGYISTSKV